MTNAAGGRVPIAESLTFLTLLLEELRNVDVGYPIGDNRILVPKPHSEVEQAIMEAGIAGVEGIANFYACCDGISLPGVHNGYFIDPVQKLAVRRPDSVPHRITGAYEADVVTIGSTGGGQLFAIRKREHDVLFLPLGRLQAGIYDGSTASVRILAGTFPEFLERLVSDVRAFVRGSPGHQFVS